MRRLSRHSCALGTRTRRLEGHPGSTFSRPGPALSPRNQESRSKTGVTKNPDPGNTNSATQFSILRCRNSQGLGRSIERYWFTKFGESPIRNWITRHPGQACAPCQVHSRNGERVFRASWTIGLAPSDRIDARRSGTLPTSVYDESAKIALHVPAQRVPSDPFGRRAYGCDSRNRAHSSRERR